MPATPPMIDLNAAKREVAFPDGIPVVLGDSTFTLPAELPTEVLDPILSEELDLVGVVVTIFEKQEEARDIARRTGETFDDGMTSYAEGILTALSARKDLLRQTVQAFKDCYRVLFGEEQFAEFERQQPSFNDYIRLTRALVPLYGVSLGEAFASPDSSETDGATPKQISSATPESTSEASSAPRVKKAS